MKQINLLVAKTLVIGLMTILVFSFESFGQTKTPPVKITNDRSFTFPDGTKLVEISRAKGKTKSKMTFTNGYIFNIESTAPIIADNNSKAVSFFGEIIRKIGGGLIDLIFGGGNSGGGGTTTTTCQPTNNGTIVINGGDNKITINVGCTVPSNPS